MRTKRLSGRVVFQSADPLTTVRMKNTAPRGNAAETLLVKELRRAGVRYRTHVRLIPKSRREADIVIPSARLAVFLDGCFWHACPRHGTQPAANRGWWFRKLRANRVRDQQTTAMLRRMRWRVFRVWEHEPRLRAAARVLRAATWRPSNVRTRGNDA